MAIAAQESNLGEGIVTFSSDELTAAIKTISDAGEAYRAAYKNLEGYFDGDLKNAVQGDTLIEFKSCFENRKRSLTLVNSFIDELIAKLSAGTTRGEDLTDDLHTNLHKNDN